MAMIDQSGRKQIRVLEDMIRWMEERVAGRRAEQKPHLLESRQLEALKWAVFELSLMVSDREEELSEQLEQPEQAQRK